MKVAIHGAAGRMGQRLVALSQADADITLVAAIESPDHAAIGQDAGIVAGTGDLNVPIASSLDVACDAIIDFSVPDAALGIVAAAVEQGTPLVVATTGFDEQGKAQLRAAGERIPMIVAPNMSLAVNLLMKLCQVAAGALKHHPSGADVEIIERHHRYKEDAPSGTALQFGQVISEVMLQQKHCHGREGRPGVRNRDEIGYHAVRAGDHPGEHTIIFGLLGETIELRVSATTRDCYAQGALVAARWLLDQPPGIYGMNDVLGL